MLKVGPVGPISKGSVLDVAKKPFERALRDLDPQLYVIWNPNKLKRHGCWEIRRKPDMNSVYDIVEYGGMTILSLQPVEFPMIHHVLDCAFLNYDQIRKLKQMDTWAWGNTAQQGAKNWLDNLDSQELERSRNVKKRADAARSYAAKHFKKELRSLKEAVLSGYNLHRIAESWNADSDL